MSDQPSSAQSAFAVLRKFARPRPNVERCELCSAALGEQHPHLLELKTRKIACSCDACAILFSDQGNTKYRRVPRRSRMLTDFRLTDMEWEALMLPINLAFFYRDSAAERVVAMYPSPAGATESQLSLESWSELEAQNPILRKMEPDVEALLVNRIGQSHDYYLVPIDECYRLVGLIRSHWRGLSGGNEVWKELKTFFDTLNARCGVRKEAALA
jgi:hypothetical protein